MVKACVHPQETSDQPNGGTGADQRPNGGVIAKAPCQRPEFLSSHVYRGVSAERKRSAMRRGGLGIATEAQPAHSLQQVLGVVIVKSA